jgi:hypothetical protein
MIAAFWKSCPERAEFLLKDGQSMYENANGVAHPIAAIWPTADKKRPST